MSGIQPGPVWGPPPNLQPGPPRRSTGLVVLSILLGCLVLAVGAAGALAFVGAEHSAVKERQRADRLQREADARRDAPAAVLEAAKADVVTVLSYDYRSLDQYLERVHAVATPKFQQEFDRAAASIKAQSARQPATTAKVLDAAVKSSTADEAQVLLFVDLATTTIDSRTPTAQRVRVVVSLKHESGKWLVDELVNS